MLDGWRCFCLIPGFWSEHQGHCQLLIRHLTAQHLIITQGHRKPRRSLDCSLHRFVSATYRNNHLSNSVRMEMERVKLSKDGS